MTARNETYRKRVQVIDPTISLLSDFERIAIRYDNADVTRKCNSGRTLSFEGTCVDTEPNCAHMNIIMCRQLHCGEKAVQKVL